jgi:anti-sigma factor RsiW
MSCEHVRRDLDAYLDRELDVESAKDVGDHIGGCVACRRLVMEREALGGLVRAAPYHTAPERLRARVLAHTTRSNTIRRAVPWAAAAALVVSLGAGIGLWRTSSTRSESFANEVVDNHVRSLMASHLFDVQSTDEHTVKPWFLGKLDFSPPVADLTSIGYPLVGGRLDYLGGRPVAALVYTRRQHTINVFVSPEHDGAVAPAAVRSIRGFHVHHWIRDSMSFWAISDLNDAEFTRFCEALDGG